MREKWRKTEGGGAGHYISFYWPDEKRGINQWPLGCIYLPLQGLSSLSPFLDTSPDGIFILAKAATFLRKTLLRLVL